GGLRDLRREPGPGRGLLVVQARRDAQRGLGRAGRRVAGRRVVRAVPGVTMSTERVGRCRPGGHRVAGLGVVAVLGASTTARGRAGQPELRPPLAPGTFGGRGRRAPGPLGGGGARGGGRAGREAGSGAGAGGGRLRFLAVSLRVITRWPPPAGRVKPCAQPSTGAARGVSGLPPRVADHPPAASASTRVPDVPG